MKKAIEKLLERLIGLPLWDAGRSVSLVWFDFGKNITQSTNRKGKTIFLGAYTVDTEATWRIRDRQGIVVASSDRFYAAGKDPYKGFEDVDWEDRPGENRCHERLEKLIAQHKKSPLVVLSGEANDWGGLTIDLSREFVVEIFQNNSLEGEYWRMYESVPKGNKHFVFSTHNIRNMKKTILCLSLW